MKNLEALMDLIDSVKGAVSELVKGVEKRLSKALESVQEELSKKIANIEESASLAVSGVKEVGDKLSSSIESLSSAHNETAERIGGVELKVSAIEKGGEALDAKIEGAIKDFGVSIKAVNDLSERLDESVASVAGGVSELDTRLSSRFSELETKLVEFEGNLVSVSGKSADVDAIMRKIEEVRESIPEVKEPELITDIRIQGKSLLIESGGQHQHEIKLPEMNDGRDGNGIESVTYDGKQFEFTLTDGTSRVVSYAMPQPESPKEPEQPREPIDVKDALRNHEGNLVLVFSNGETKDLGRVNGKDGKSITDIERHGDQVTVTVGGEDEYTFYVRDGIDGRDGFGFDDMDVQMMDDGRTVNFRFARGEQVKSFPIRFDIPIHQGGYNPEMEYEKADMVAYGGSSYYATRATTGETPGVKDSPWVLMSSAGRSVRGERGLAGKDGRNGRDLRPFSGGSSYGG